MKELPIAKIRRLPAPSVAFGRKTSKNSAISPAKGRPAWVHTLHFKETGPLQGDTFSSLTLPQRDRISIGWTIHTGFQPLCHSTKVLGTVINLFQLPFPRGPSFTETKVGIAPTSPPIKNVHHGFPSAVGEGSCRQVFSASEK